jgi:hypothetical protein
MLTAVVFTAFIDAKSLSFRFPVISFVCHSMPKVIFPELRDVGFIDPLLSGLAISNNYRIYVINTSTYTTVLLLADCRAAGSAN